MKLASRRRRFVAFTIDGCIVLLAIFLASVLFVEPLISIVPWSDRFWMFVIGLSAVSFLMFVCKDSVEGMSIGRLAMGIVVRDEEKCFKVPEFRRLAFRNLMLLLWPIEMLTMLFRKDKRRFGDRVTHTNVIHNPLRSIRLVRLALAGVVIVTVGSFFLITGNTLIMCSDAYKSALVYLRNDDETNRITGGIKQFGFIAKGDIAVNNGLGTAYIQLFIDGKSKDQMVNVLLTRDENGKWSVTHVQPLK